MQRACAVLSSVVCPAVQYFSTLCHKRHDFRKKKGSEHEIGVSDAEKKLDKTSIFSASFCEIFLILRRIN